MKYSYNQDRQGVVFANMKDINASFKDLGAVCDSIRYRSLGAAMDLLDAVSTGTTPIPYRKHNASMGSRHELGGKKGRTPKKCAMLVKKVLVNASANAEQKGLDPEALYVVHASANKTIIAMRRPSKGALLISGGPSGYMSSRRSDLEFARVELGLSMLDEKKLSKNIVSRIKQLAKEEKKKPAKKAEEKPKPPKKSIITKTTQEQQKEKPKEQKQQEPAKQQQTDKTPAVNQ